MPRFNFSASDPLIQDLDQALSLRATDAITDRIRSILGERITNRSLGLPDDVFVPIADHYARRELYHSPTLDYSIVAMTWGPSQGTFLHDHSGMWCVEGVCHGHLEITQYDLAEQRGECYRFVVADRIAACAGSTGSLIPPHEYHTIHNPSPTAIAVSLHIYAGRMDCCSCFKPLDDDPAWYAKEQQTLPQDR